MSNTLLKNAAHSSFAGAIYKEILSRSARYYHFIGRTLTWESDMFPPTIVDSKAYERYCRNELIAMKEITPSDISFIIPRINWLSGVVYDNYDDQYSTEIQGINLISGGTSVYPYAAIPDITIGEIVPLLSPVSIGVQYFYDGFLYTVTTAGTTGSTNFVLTGVYGDIIPHGTAVLTCAGIQATATCTVGISGPNYQKVDSVSMIKRGFGYTYPPTINFSAGLAAGTAVLKNGLYGDKKLENTLYYVYSDSNIYVCVENNGGGASTVAPTGISSDYLETADGYIWKYMSSIPVGSKFLTLNYIPVITANQNQYSANGSIINVFIDNQGIGYIEANDEVPLLAEVLTGDHYYYDGHVYTVIDPGITPATYVDLGTTTGIPYVFGTAVLNCNGVMTSIEVIGDGVNASLTPLVSDGRISGVQINNAGSGYSYINCIVHGTGVNARVASSLFAGRSQYSHQAQVEYMTVEGNICSIQMISNGYNYSDTPTVSIIGDGVGATAEAVVEIIDADTRITKIIITNRGSNYNWASVIITDSTGTGASARAVISPFGGLGRDSITQFSCNTLMFYTRFSDNTNQGMVVTNDYRQIGIIKDPTRLNDGIYLSSNFATTCWKVTATLLISAEIFEDDIVTLISNGVTYSFRVISISGLDILLLPLDNGIPVSGMQMFKTSTINFFIAFVSQPTVDKYSGDMLFIDNDSLFVATDDSPASIRTVINF